MRVVFLNLKLKFNNYLEINKYTLTNEKYSLELTIFISSNSIMMFINLNNSRLLDVTLEYF